MMAGQPPHGVEKYLDAEVVSADGQKLGHAAKLLNNRVTGVAEWIVVEAGLLGREKLIVPLAGSDFAEGLVMVAYKSDQVHTAPHTEPDDDAGALPPEGEDALNRHFGLGAQAT
jgi:hypothetical protein